MSDYGLKIFDSAGNCTLDLTDTITRLRYSNEVSGGSSSSTVLSDISGKSTVQFGLALEANKLPHSVTRSGTTISWTARSTYNRPSSNTLILVFLYD
jgi:hypothetical protein